LIVKKKQIKGAFTMDSTPNRLSLQPLLFDRQDLCGCFFLEPTPKEVEFRGIHDRLCRQFYAGRTVCHLSLDSTPVEARQQAAGKSA
jgi:hypothetical protein